LSKIAAKPGLTGARSLNKAHTIDKVTEIDSNKLAKALPQKYFFCSQ
jgi:hypothetical protein